MQNVELSGDTYQRFFFSHIRLFGLILLGLCTIPFYPGLNGTFLLDDIANLAGSRAPTGTLGEILHAIFWNDSGLLHRPISNLTFLLNYHWIGSDAYDFKIVNLVLHWLNACILWFLAARLLEIFYPERTTHERQTCGLLIATLWMLHPIQISTVLYVVQRMEELSALFIMLAMLIFLRLIKRPFLPKVRSVLSRSGAVWAVVLLGLFSKENAVLFPCFVLVIFFVSDESYRKLVLRNDCSGIFFALCSWIPIIAGGVIAAFAFSWFMGGYAMREFTLSDRLFTEPFIIFRYLGTILIPNIKHMGLYLDDMPLHRADTALAWFVMLLFLAMPIVALTLRKRAPALSFGILWYVTAHLLESTALPLELAFEHRNYLALFGPIFTVGYYLFKFLSLSKLKGVHFVVIIPITILAASTLVRAHQWSGFALFTEHEADNHPLSPRAQNAAVTLDIASGEVDKVEARAKTVQTLKPDLFWPLSLDINLACGIPDHAVQWGKMLAQIEIRPNDLTILGMLHYDTNAILESNCQNRNIDPVRFDAFLSDVAHIFESKKMQDSLERIIVLRSYIARHQNRPDAVRQLLNDAARANPQGIVALHDLSYFELNTGRIDAAATAIEDLSYRVRTWTPINSYQVDELRGFLDQARSEKTVNEKKTHRDN